MQSISTGTVNVSIRHSPAENRVLMTWAQENVFSFVIYYKQRLSLSAQRHVGEWTRSMIELALSHGGTYYLPYQLHATQNQFQRAYPNWEKFKKLRQHIGASRFTNTMWSQYGV
jgi:FAD/FMN-containing dehydrogenase